MGSKRAKIHAAEPHALQPGRNVATLAAIPVLADVSSARSPQARAPRSSASPPIAGSSPRTSSMKRSASSRRMSKSIGATPQVTDPEDDHGDLDDTATSFGLVSREEC